MAGCAVQPAAGKDARSGCAGSEGDEGVAGNAIEGGGAGTTIKDIKITGTLTLESGATGCSVIDVTVPTGFDKVTDFTSSNAAGSNQVRLKRE